MTGIQLLVAIWILVAIGIAMQVGIAMIETKDFEYYNEEVDEDYEYEIE